MVTGAAEAVGPSIREQCSPAAEGPFCHFSGSVGPGGLQSPFFLEDQVTHTFLGSCEAAPTPPPVAAILSPLVSRCKLTIHSPLPEMSG